MQCVIRNDRCFGMIEDADNSAIRLRLINFLLRTGVRRARETRNLIFAVTTLCDSQTEFGFFHKLYDKRKRRSVNRSKCGDIPSLAVSSNSSDAYFVLSFHEYNGIL